MVINIWEETAWTGVFQTRLEERHNWAVASAITAIPFAAIHLPLQFFLDQPVTLASLAAAFAVYLLLGLLVRPLLAVFRRGTRDSLLLVALLHSVFNRTNNQNGIAATLLEGDARQLTMLMAVVLLDRGDGRHRSVAVEPPVWSNPRPAGTEPTITASLKNARLDAPARKRFDDHRPPLSRLVVGVERCD